MFVLDFNFKTLTISEIFFLIEKGFYIPSESKIHNIFMIMTLEITHITTNATP
jgi:hypothetical protein